ncbi:myristylated membrane [Shrimp hemocyte iridescent virus]|uniref:Myristylated membrane n=1 Tax=Shrimp hemocyte iridescent virus TaxID=2039780 RepID=A0A291B108_9VIRU|nr:myristylated membrane [Shrimp hemocyte iridescent virus]ATE87178.1 myristylated membrane [Shrimp hemocyte iridescent virus]
MEIHNTKTQTLRDNSYEPGSNKCYCGQCWAGTSISSCHKTKGIEDWQIGTKNCCFTCPKQKICVPPNRLECRIGLSSKGKDPLIHFGWKDKAPNLECVYNLDDIDTEDQLRLYLEKFTDEDHVGNFHLMKKFATMKSDKCTNGMKECIMIKSKTNLGKICEEWFETLSKERKDYVMRDYCAENDTEDCACINRTQNLDYRKKKENGYFFNDGCWFVPCANKMGKYLIPSDVSNPTCPSNVCNVIYDLEKNMDVNFQNNYNDINCDFHQKKRVGSRKGESATDKKNSFLFKKFWNKYYIQISLLLLVVALLLPFALLPKK